MKHFYERKPIRTGFSNIIRVDLIIEEVEEPKYPPWFALFLLFLFQFFAYFYLFHKIFANVSQQCSNYQKYHKNYDFFQIYAGKFSSWRHLVYNLLSLPVEILKLVLEFCVFLVKLLIRIISVFAGALLWEELGLGKSSWGQVVFIVSGLLRLIFHW